MAARKGLGRQQSVYMSHKIWDEVERRAKAERRSENQIIELSLEAFFDIGKECTHKTPIRAIFTTPIK
jgi:hypothetical protein